MAVAVLRGITFIPNLLCLLTLSRIRGGGGGGGVLMLMYTQAYTSHTVILPLFDWIILCIYVDRPQALYFSFIRNLTAKLDWLYICC